jgi:O-antigen/teichoic acid export membrane protein
LLLGVVAGQAAVALYSLADQAYKFLQTGVQVLSQAMYPYMARKNDGINYLRNLKIFAPLVIFAIAVSYFITPLLFVYLFGPDAAQTKELIEYFHVIFVAHALNVFLGYPFCVAIGTLRVANESVVYAAAFFVFSITLLFFLNLISVLTVMASILLSELVSSFFRVKNAVRYVRSRAKDSHYV